MYPCNFINTNIIESIIKWNAERYKQVYSPKLTSELLNEEAMETQQALKANNRVEYCDGLGDVFFVAIGALWKQGFSIQGLYNILTQWDCVIPLPACIMWNVYDARPIALSATAFSAFWYLEHNLQSTKAATKIIGAICNSNHTKTAMKTEPDVKANLDKGINFIPPTKDIKDIIKFYTEEGKGGLC